LLLWVALVVLAGTGCTDSGTGARAGTGGPIPLEYFLGRSERKDEQESPARTRRAFLQSSPGLHSRVRNLFVQEAGTGRTIQVTTGVDRNIREFRWFNEDRLGFLRDPDGAEGYRLYAVNADGSGFRELTPDLPGGTGAAILWSDPAAHSRWLVAMGPARGPKDLYWVDGNTGAWELKERNLADILYAIPDRRGQVLLALAGDGLTQTLQYRDTERSPWRALATATHPEVVAPLALDPDLQRLGFPAQEASGILAVSNRGRDKRALVLLDPSDGRVRRVLAQDPRQDAAYPRVPVARGSQGGCLAPPGALAGVYPEPLDGPRLSGPEKGQPVDYLARDGLVIPAFLFPPPGAAPVPHPAVILCHGGPEYYVPTGENPVAAYLASRGLVVLEPCFRGTQGLGREFQAAGYGQWGRAMQDDLADGAEWLVGMGFADRGRIGIMGESFGGYGALAGVSLDPGRYRCAVAIDGPANLVTFLDSPHVRASEAYWRLLMLGDPAADPASLAAVSPVHHAHRVRVPVLIVHAVNDARVPIKQSEQMVAELRAHGSPVQFLRLEGEGHDDWCERSDLEVYRAVERFLNEHLGSALGPPATLLGRP
jgi:dipeptidyl aminopeptidase/acylaminoacyl peptidase